MSLGERCERPPLPPELDDSRARERRDDPTGWRFDDAARAGVWRAIAERRDIRRFRPDAISQPLIRRLLEAAHSAPSVGLMQPWRFIVIESEQTKAAMQAIAARERLVQANGGIPAESLTFVEHARSEIVVCQEIAEVPLNHIVKHLVGSRRDYPELADRLHTRIDIDWPSLCLVGTD